MDRLNIVQEVRRLVKGQQRGVLATAGEEGAYASLMAYTPLDNGQMIAFATARDTQKHRNLQRDLDVAMLIDNRADMQTTPDDILTATAIGRTEPASEDKSERRRQLAKRHPRLREFFLDDACDIFVLNVRVYRVAGRFQTGNELETVVHGGEL